MAYATLAELKAWLDDYSDSYNTQMLAALSAASAMIDRFTGRSFGEKTITERVQGNGTPTIFPANVPISSVASCTVDGATVAVSASDIGVRRTDGGSFDGFATILVTYTGGLAVPEDVKTATLITAQAIYSSADLDANMVGENIAGAMSGSFQPGGPGSLPRAAQTILSPLRRVHMG